MIPFRGKYEIPALPPAVKNLKGRVDCVIRGESWTQPNLMLEAVG